MGDLDGQIFNKLTKILNYYTNQKYVTLHFYLGSGTDQTIDLTGIKGTLKSAFIKTTGGAQAGRNSPDTTPTVTFNFTLNGSALESGTVLARGFGTQAQGGGASGGAPILMTNVISDLDLDASNTYTLSFTNTGTGNYFYSSNSELIITFEPEGL